MVRTFYENYKTRKIDKTTQTFPYKNYKCQFFRENDFDARAFISRKFPLTKNDNI